MGKQDRGLKLMSLHTVRDLMEAHPQPREPEPGADGLKEDDSLRVALSIMLWQNWRQVPVFNADGQETGTITRDRIIQEGA